jgi:hypothetical protein
MLERRLLFRRQKFAALRKYRELAQRKVGLVGMRRIQVMSARLALFGLYREWQELTENEGSAIRSSAWREVQNCQNAKLILQQRIVNATAALKREVALGNQDREELEVELRGIIDNLISLETRNSVLLAEQRRVVEARRNEVAQSSRTMHQMHQTCDRGGSLPWRC